METVIERLAAPDVHKEQMTACVRVPGKGGSREQHFAEFSTAVAGLLTSRSPLSRGSLSCCARFTAFSDAPPRWSSPRSASTTSISPTAKQLASWAGQCPGNDQSAGKRRSGTPRKGSKWLDRTLEEAAMAAIRTKDSYLAAQYARLRPRRGHKKALGAGKHSIIGIIWHMLTTGEPYPDLGGDYFRKRDPERLTKRLITQLEALGHKVILEELPQAA